MILSKKCILVVIMLGVVGSGQIYAAALHKRRFVNVHEQLYLAAKEGNVEEALSLLKQNANVNYVHREGSSYGGYGARETPLITAAAHNSVRVIPALLAMGANTACRNGNGLNCLQIAACNGYDDTIRIILAAQMNGNAWCWRNWQKAIYSAAQNNHDQVVKILLAAAMRMQVPHKSLSIGIDVDTYFPQQERRSAIIPFLFMADINGFNFFYKNDLTDRTLYEESLLLISMQGLTVQNVGDDDEKMDGAEKQSIRQEVEAICVNMQQLQVEAVEELGDMRVDDTVLACVKAKTELIREQRLLEQQQLMLKEYESRVTESVADEATVMVQAAEGLQEPQGPTKRQRR